MDFENGAVRPATRETPGIGHRIARFARRRVRKRAFSRGGLTLLPPSPPVPFPFPRAGLRRAPVEPRRAEGHAPRAHRRVQDGRLPRLAAVQLEPAGARVRPVRHPPERRRQGADRRGRPRLRVAHPVAVLRAHRRRAPDGGAQDALVLRGGRRRAGVRDRQRRRRRRRPQPHHVAHRRDGRTGHAVPLVRVRGLATRRGPLGVRARAPARGGKAPRGDGARRRAAAGRRRREGSVSVSGRPVGAEVAAGAARAVHRGPVRFKARRGRGIAREAARDVPGLDARRG